MSQPITHIIMDLSDVLVGGVFGIGDMLEPKVGMASAEIDPYFCGPNLYRVLRAESSEEEYLQIILSNTGWDISTDQLKQMLRENMTRLIDETHTILPELSEKYDLTLLSDHGLEWVEHVEQHHEFLSYFHRKLYSCHTGYMKRDPDCFPWLLKELKVQAEECLFIDDLDKNIRMAQSHGLHSIQYLNHDQLEQELIELGLIGARV